MEGAKKRGRYGDRNKLKLKKEGKKEEGSQSGRKGGGISLMDTVQLEGMIRGLVLELDLYKNPLEVPRRVEASWKETAIVQQDWAFSLDTECGSNLPASQGDTQLMWRLHADACTTLAGGGGEVNIEG